MSENGNIADVMKKARRGDERRASYVYLMGKYGSKKAKFKAEEDETYGDGFSIRFRLSQAYQGLEEQEIQASIPNLRPRRRRTIRIATLAPQRMISIAESTETNNDESSRSNINFNQSTESMESPPTTGGTTSGLSALDKLRNTAKKAVMVKAWSRSQKCDQKDVEEEQENRDSNNSVVRFKSEDHPSQSESPRKSQNGHEADGGKTESQTAKQSVVGFKSKNEPPQPTSSRSSRTAKKILVKRDSSNVLVNKRDKETARLIASIQREKAKTQEARSKKEREIKKMKEKVACDEGEVERKRGILKTVRLFDNRPRSQSEPQGSKFFRTIMKRRFGTSGVGYTFSSLLDSASFSDPGKTIAGSSSGYGYTDTFLTCGESMIDMDASTCVGSMVESSSVRTSKRTSILPRSESPERPKSSLSKSSRRNDEISNRKQRTKSISQSHDPRRNPKVSSKTEGDEKLSEKKHQFTSEDDEGARFILEEQESAGYEKNLRFRPAKYLYHMCNCHQVARPSTMKKLTKISRRRIAGVIEIYGCRGSPDCAEDGVSSGIRTLSVSSGISGGSGGGTNVVCPFCTFPKERVHAWMEDINDINTSITSSVK